MLAFAANPRDFREELRMQQTVIPILCKAVILNILLTESDDDRMMESWVDLRRLVTKKGKSGLQNPYFREMRCLFVKQGGIDLFVKCMKTFHKNSDLVEFMVVCMGHVVQEKESRHEMMRQDFVQQVLTLVNTESSGSCWRAMNILTIMLNDRAEMWQKTKMDFQVTLVKIDDIYDVWDISSVMLGFRMSTFHEILKLVQSDIPQLQRHALWSLAHFTRQENSKTSISTYRLTFIYI